MLKTSTEIIDESNRSCGSGLEAREYLAILKVRSHGAFFGRLLHIHLEEGENLKPAPATLAKLLSDIKGGEKGFFLGRSD